jgi:16S rRNA A1518/A1519 N6-dimethyltransferase RsmA/KsgA/DIM1 with predicted DNA glycosylase/AP lyase activity
VINIILNRKDLRVKIFLINEDIYVKIIDIADLKSDDIVLEIGPGLGFLT